MTSRNGVNPMGTRRTDERGMALIMVMLLTVAVAALVAGAIFLTSSSTLISKGQEREEEMRNAADAGIELGRSALNGQAVSMPTSGYSTLFASQQVLDANGNVIPNVTRSVYYGPTSTTTGEFGVFGSVVSVITDPSGAVVVRRGELNQESFAKFGYFTDSEGSGICFGNGDNIFGPVHTNDNMCIYNTGATYWKTVEVGGTITGLSYGSFHQGYTQHASIVPMPSTAALTLLQSQASIGGMAFTEPTPSAPAGQARIRIHFMSIDLLGDGRVTDPDDGFYRVYQDTGVINGDVVMASRINNAYSSRNCGHYHTIAGRQVFFTANQHYKGIKDSLGATVQPPSWPAGENTGTGTTEGNQSLTVNAGGAYLCWLGGDEHLQYTWAAGGLKPRNTFVAADSFGAWVKYTATPDPAIIAGLKNPASNIVDTSLANRTLLAQYLWPLSRNYNPNNKGVIYVTGRLAVSGVVNSQVTVAASNKVFVVDDLKYAIAPGAAPCLSADILGLIAGDSLLMSDNTLNAPWDYTSGNALDPSGTARNYKTNSDETLHGVILTLMSFGAENYGNGGTSQQPCQTSTNGRGCLNLTGGIIQQQRGAVGTTSGSGYVKRYNYDNCAFQTPPPYFPTTGRYDRNRYYEIDPVGFSVASFFAGLTPH
ncbi:MAG: hypothetical protein ACHQU8_06915 [Gemmatimonadales bacterium]